MMKPSHILFAAALSLAGSAAALGDAAAQEQGWSFSDWFSGSWSLTVGAAGYVAPTYEGADSLSFFGQPLISLGRTGSLVRFSSINDNPSFAVIDSGVFRFGPVGKLLFKRDDGTSNDLRGLSDVPFGGEVGVFAELYPLDWLRLRAELRHGIRSHHGLAGDLYADAFTDLTPVLRLSGGPRLSFGSRSYFDAYYGVTPAESVASGLAVYSPDGGIKSVGVGGALTWKATDKLTTSIFGEYARLTGPASDSSLVQQRGSENQFTLGVSATYRFDFNL